MLERDCNLLLVSSKAKDLTVSYGAGSQSRGNGRGFSGPEMLVGTKDLITTEKPWQGHVEEEKE